MHWLSTAFFGAIALAWAVQVIDIARGLRTLPSLCDARLIADGECPTISILFAARNEAEKLPEALKTLLAQDYPHFEVVAADDRSEDGTQQILSGAAKRSPQLKFLRIDSLPPGWLGKPHALERAYEHSNGEWLVFTDADVHFAPDLLRRSMALAKSQQWEHLTLLGRVEMVGFGEKVAMTFFGMSFIVGVKPWRVNDPHSHGYAGIGSFQLIRRSTYEAIGTHRRLAMEVVDDMKLGKLVKQGGFRSGVAKAGAAVRVRWHAGLANIIRGTTKNFFATSGFRLWLTSLQILALLLMSVAPFAALPFTHGWARVFDILAVGLPVAAQAGVAREFRISPLYALTQPLGALVFCWMLARSTIVTLWRGGITWRGTFYPLEELRRGVV